jgi:fatty acid synthase subunit beta
MSYKVYFGKKLDGTVADLFDMTYYEVIHRMVQLMFVKGTNGNKDRWIHPDYEHRVFQFALRIEERFRRLEKKEKSKLPPREDLHHNPFGWVKRVRLLPSNTRLINS